jgi:hypothetical protein
MAAEGEISVSAWIGLLEEYKKVVEASIEALRRLETLRVGLPGLPSLGSTSNHRGVEADTFVGMSIGDATPKYLAMVGRPARTTEEIVQALLRGGLQRVSPASVATILIRIHNADGPVVRVQKGLWGLAEWYPKRPPRSTRKPEEKESASPKRRGRPPKNRPKEEATVKRPRGRPPKPKPQVEEAPKRPGRPKKVPVEGEAKT